MAAILKIEKLQYLQSRFADFDEILHDDIFVLQSLPAVQKNQTFKTPRWQTAAILTIVICDISATV